MVRLAIRKNVDNVNISQRELPAPGVVSKLEQLLANKPIILQLLKFVAIGVLNTALDFIVYNYISEKFGISQGIKLGQATIPGFILAVVQSYFWNKYWAFSGTQHMVSVWKNFVRLVLVGLLGGIAFVLVGIGAGKAAAPSFYITVFLLFVVLEVVLWEIFGFSKLKLEGQPQTQFLAFILVSVVGLVINIVLVSFISQYVHLTANVGLNRNISKIVATFVSLAWNFVGYKLVVFKK